MAREFRLISYLGQWQVCSKARRVDEDGQPYVVWIYGKERIEFCRVGLEDDIFALPLSDKQNFFGDHFNHAIDLIMPGTDQREKIGGVNDAGAARAAFEYLVRNNPPTYVVTMREGSRIMERENGRAVWEPLIQRWRLAPE